MWASVVAAKPSKPKYVDTFEAYAFGKECGASWFDMDEYNPAIHGDYKAFFLASAKIYKEEVARLRSKQKLEEPEKCPPKCPPKCKCGCGRLAHPNPPRPDFIGYCCGWCMKHKGLKGHGEACGK